MGGIETSSFQCFGSTLTPSGYPTNYYTSGFDYENLNDFDHQRLSDSLGFHSKSSGTPDAKDTLLRLPTNFSEDYLACNTIIRGLHPKQHKPLTFKSVLGRIQDMLPAWFYGVWSGLMVVLCCLSLNIVCLIWAKKNFDIVGGIALVFTGSCPRVSAITTYVDLAINTVSTLLLATSCNASQLLLSPTRTEADIAHTRGHWVHVGAAGWGNIKWIKPWRICLLVLLLFSSLPLHLV
jgi:hypothetical protein